MSESPEAGVSGPLAVHAEGFRRELAGLGYSPRTARDHGYVLAQLSCWLVAEQLSPLQLTEPVLDLFVAAGRGQGLRRGGGGRAEGLPRVAVETVAAAAGGLSAPGGSHPGGRAAGA